SGVAAALGVVVLVASIGMFRHRNGGPGSHAAPPPPELGPVIARAEVGDRAAGEELALRPESGGTAAGWMGVGKGRAPLGDAPAAIAALRRAVETDSSLAADPGLLADVRHAVDDDAAQRAALDLAAGPLGESGADLLFDVWASTTEKNQTTTLARALLDKP